MGQYSSLDFSDQSLQYITNNVTCPPSDLRYVKNDIVVSLQTNMNITAVIAT